MLNRPLALLDVLYKPLTFFLRFFDQRRRRIEWYGFLVTHCPAPDQIRARLEAAPLGVVRFRAPPALRSHIVKSELQQSVPTAVGAKHRETCFTVNALAVWHEREARWKMAKGRPRKSLLACAITRRKDPAAYPGCLQFGVFHAHS